MPERRTPLYDIHMRMGAQMVKGGGDFMFPHVVPADTARATRVLQNFPMMDDITLQLALEGLSLGAQHEPPGVEHAAESDLDLAPMSLDSGLKVEEGNAHR
jgi:hypothetical protein